MNEIICGSFPDDSIPIFKGYFYETIRQFIKTAYIFTKENKQSVDIGVQ